ncbi:hypothetical protein EST38_g390 [Candolleomyces aberdarensis]|uniref:Uncharacterized protein n=1 Tax=Candolleomyces aberdarensis TaxID=2316362 RepID=A0A4Q2E0K8_9AGAR|nr:hypothetical protein EST38_g390 [Candolleomyces aberdarensis]
MTSISTDADTGVVVDVQPQPTPPEATTAATTTNVNVNSNVTVTDDKPIGTEHRFTFPRDFPKVPAGVTIISFSAWKERGICIDPRPDDPDALEVDTLGIPTVTMSAKGHKTNYCKTNTKRKKMKQEVKQKYLDHGLPVPWWVTWEEGESVRLAAPTNASDSKLSKFLAAAIDFKNGRKWPPLVNSQVDPSRLWTLMEVFLGVVGHKTRPERASRKKVFYDPAPNDEGYDDDDDDVDVDMDDDEEFATATTVDGKDKKAVQFLKDPERMVKIFLSSHIRAKGIIWSKINLEQTPRLWAFFLEFLLRSRVLPRSEAELRAALAVAKQALIELPLTSVLSADLPDKFSKGCRECWGEKTEVFRTLDADEEWLASLRGDQKPTDGGKPNDAGEQKPTDGELNDAGGQKPTDGELNDAGEQKPADGEPSDAGEQTEDTVPVVPEPDQEEGEAASAAPAQLDIVPEEAQGDQKEAANGWGAVWDSTTNEGWGAVDEDNDWAMNTEKPEDEVEENPWMTVQEELSLEHLLGPSLVELPTTHITGVVEQSLRRITDLIPIPTNLPPKPAEEAGAVDAAAIELEMERTFPKVVLSPWLSWDGGEMPAYSDPRILDTSQGNVADPPYTTRTADDPPATPGVHDPGNDPITVLVHPDVFEKLIKGICIAGTWVQMVRKPVEPSDSAPAAKKKKKGKKKAPANFWYVDEVAAVLPGYWTAPRA